MPWSWEIACSMASRCSGRSSALKETLIPRPMVLSSCSSTRTVWDLNTPSSSSTHPSEARGARESLHCKIRRGVFHTWKAAWLELYRIRDSERLQCESVDPAWKAVVFSFQRRQDC